MGRPIRDIAFWDGSGQGTRTGGLAATVRIATRRGLLPVATLRPGDLVLTRDSGYRPLRALCPLGPLPCLQVAGLWLRPGQGLLDRGPEGEEVLIPAQYLATGAPSLTRRLVFVLRLDRHEILLADGRWTESAPGPGIPARRRIGGAGPIDLFPQNRKIRVAEARRLA